MNFETVLRCLDRLEHSRRTNSDLRFDLCVTCVSCCRYGVTGALPPAAKA
jgi:hypothetical protein